MKHSIAIFILVGSMAAVSCGKWLDVMPQDTVTEERMFSDYGGYRSALNGLYQTMAEDELYGKEMTWGLVSALSQYMDNAMLPGDTAEPLYVNAEKYDYDTDEVRNYAADIWEKSYNIIANCNNLIQHIESADRTMFPDQEITHEVEMLTGEAYAVRAFLHFDLLRVFGPPPATGMDEPAIPYNDLFPNKFFDRLTTRQVLGRIIEDLEHARPLLELFDGPDAPNENLSIYDRFTPRIYRDGIGFSRGYHFNSIAIGALLARVYMYAGDLEKANQTASDVWDTYVGDMNNYLYYTTYQPGDVAGRRSSKMESEVIFGAYRQRLPISYNEMVAYNGQDGSDDSFFLKNVDYMYGTYRVDRDDYRLTKLINALTPGSVDKHYISARYLEKDDTEDKENFLIPIIRMSEMLYIKAEYLATEGNDLPGAIALLNDHRIKRGCVTRTLSGTMTQAEFMDELLYDQWKEFTLEGQHFFLCKRLNLPTMRSGGAQIPMNNATYMLPVPDSETTN